MDKCLSDYKDFLLKSKFKRIDAVVVNPAFVQAISALLDHLVVAPSITAINTASGPIEFQFGLIPFRFIGMSHGCIFRFL